MSARALRFETRSRAKEELRRAIASVEKVKKWEKKWVSVGGNNCKLRVYKWVPKEKEEVTKKKEEAVVKTEAVPPAVPVPAVPAISPPAKENTAPPATPSTNTQFITNAMEDSRDSYTNSSDKMEFMKYCKDPDNTQDSINDSENTGTLDQSAVGDGTTSSKPDSEKASADNGDSKVTVAMAFDGNAEPKLPSEKRPISNEGSPSAEPPRKKPRDDNEK